jgi:hypothetical protein
MNMMRGFLEVLILEGLKRDFPEVLILEELRAKNSNGLRAFMHNHSRSMLYCQYLNKYSK